MFIATLFTSQDMETNVHTDKEDMVHIYNGTLVSCPKE